MCKYCDADSLKKMHNEVDAILSEDYSDSTEDKLLNTLGDYSVFTIGGWGGYTFYFLDGTQWDESRLSKRRVQYKYGPRCGRKLSD